MDGSFELKAEMWRHASADGWYFVTFPEVASAEIRERFGMMSPGFGSLRVEVAIGDTRWRTSIFYDTKLRCYLLPMKAAVRKAANLAEGDQVEFLLRVL
jgi:hypothetical protein